MGRCFPIGLLLLLAAAGAHGADFVLRAAPADGGEFAYNKEFMSGILQAFMSPKGVNATRLIEAFNPTPCLQRCMPSLNQLLESLGTQHSLGDSAKDTTALCRQLESIEECAASSKCDSKLLDLATKSYKFACVDKIESLGDSLKCAREAFSGARVECETGCITDRSTAAALSVVDPAKLPVDVASLCESSVCLLGCMQRSLNAACMARGSTPSLFNAILASSTSSDDNTLSSVFSGLLPSQCRDVLKTQTDLPQQIANLASIGVDSLPNSVGKPRGGAQLAAAPTTTTVPSTTLPTTTTTPRPTTTTTTTVAAASTSPAHPLLWSPAPVEATVMVDNQARTLQCRLFDWERRPIATPSIDQLARIIAEQFLNGKGGGMQMRAADDDEDNVSSTANGDDDAAFRRWMASHGAANYRDIGYGARAARDGDGRPIPQLRADSSPSAAPAILPSWFNLVAAGLFPFVIYLMD